MIGMFDSGVGGLSILRHVRTELPEHAIVYVADQAHAPYGDRSMEWVQARSHTIAEHLIDAGAGIIVVACNTASAAALSSLRSDFPDTPFVGMEPAVKPAAESTVRGVVGVLATRATFQGELYASVVDRHGTGIGVVERVGAGLVELVESGELGGETARRIVAGHLRPMMTAGVDKVVLGCTHYPFLASLMREVLGLAVQLIDPAPAVAQQTARIVSSVGLDGTGGHVSYSTSGDPDRFAEQTAALLGVDPPDVGVFSVGAPDLAQP